MIRKILEPSPIPNQITATVIIATDGMNRRNSVYGSSTFRTGRNEPMAKPIGIPSREPAMKPARMRWRAGGQVLEQDAVAQQHQALAEHDRRRREQHGTDHVQGGQLPDQEQADEPEDVAYRTRSLGVAPRCRGRGSPRAGPRRFPCGLEFPCTRSLFGTGDGLGDFVADHLIDLLVVLEKHLVGAAARPVQRHLDHALHLGPRARRASRRSGCRG